MTKLKIIFYRLIYKYIKRGLSTRKSISGRLRMLEKVVVLTFEDNNGGTNSPWIQIFNDTEKRVEGVAHPTKPSHLFLWIMQSITSA